MSIVVQLFTDHFHRSLLTLHIHFVVIQEKKRVKDLWSKAFDGTKKLSAGSTKAKFNKEHKKWEGNEEKKEMSTADKARHQREIEQKAKEEATITINKLNMKRPMQEEENGKTTLETSLSYVSQIKNVNRFMNFCKSSMNKGMGLLQRNVSSEAQEDAPPAQYSSVASSPPSSSSEIPDITLASSDYDDTASASVQLFEELNKEPEVVENKTPILLRRGWGAIPTHVSFSQVVEVALANKKELERLEMEKAIHVESNGEEKRAVQATPSPAEKTVVGSAPNKALCEKEIEDGVSEISTECPFSPEEALLPENRESTASPQPQQGPVLIQQTPDIIRSCDSLFGTDRKQTDKVSDVTGCDSLGEGGKASLTGNDNTAGDIVEAGN